MMQNLRQLALQLAEIWKQLGLNQRISLALGTVVVIAGLLGLTLWSSRPDYALLYGKLDDGEAAKVIAALDEAKIPYQTSRGGHSILIPSDKIHSMRAKLAGDGIPRGEGIGFEIFDKPNFGISDFVQHANYMRAVQGELARTIGQIDMVESARVMIVMPEYRLLVDNHRKPTASVFVRTKGNGHLPASAVNSIRLLVANSVENLQLNNVSVVDQLGNVLSENRENDSLGGLSNSQLSARRELEQYLGRQAEGMLERALGAGQAVVRVAADINWDTTTRTEETFDPESQIARSTTLNDETTSSTVTEGGGSGGPADGGSGGAAGVAAANSDPSSAGGNNSQVKKKVTTSTYELSRVLNNTMLTAGGIKRLSAAVFIAQKMEGEGAERKPVVRTDEEIQKLKRIVQSALGIQDSDPVRKDEITIEQIPFNDQPATELTMRLETDGKRQFYWDIGKNVLYALVGLIMLVVFLKLLSKTTSSDLQMAVPNQSDEYNSNGGAGKIPSMVSVEALNSLIRENPASVGQAMRSWLGTNNTKSN